MRQIKQLFLKTARTLLDVVERMTNTMITVTPGRRVKIRVHPDAATDGRSMQLYVNLVRKLCTFTPGNIFEIGANYAQDAEYLRRSFGIDDKQVYVFEPHPQIFAEIKKMYAFNAIDSAVSNAKGKTLLHAVDVNTNGNTGISSLREALTTDKKNFFDVQVDVIRMDDFMREHRIDSVDFLKLDVEGMNYEVLEGFGERLADVKAIQTEGEYIQYWDGQKLFKDIEEILVRNGFRLVSFILSDDGVQSDSLWVQEKYLKKPAISELPSPAASGD